MADVLVTTVIIDASQATQGAQEYERATRRIEESSVRATASVDRLGQSLDRAGKTMRDTTSHGTALAGAQQNLSGSATNAASGREDYNSRLREISRLSQSGAYNEAEDLAQFAGFRQLAEIASHQKAFPQGNLGQNVAPFVAPITSAVTPEAVLPFVNATFADLKGNPGYTQIIRQTEQIQKNDPVARQTREEITEQPPIGSIAAAARSAGSSSLAEDAALAPLVRELTTALDRHAAVMSRTEATRTAAHAVAPAGEASAQRVAGGALGVPPNSIQSAPLQSIGQRAAGLTGNRPESTVEEAAALDQFSYVPLTGHGIRPGTGPFGMSEAGVAASAAAPTLRLAEQAEKNDAVARQTSGIAAAAEHNAGTSSLAEEAALMSAIRELSVSLVRLEDAVRSASAAGTAVATAGSPAAASVVARAAASPAVPAPISGASAGWTSVGRAAGDQGLGIMPNLTPSALRAAQNNSLPKALAQYSSVGFDAAAWLQSRRPPKPPPNAVNAEEFNKARQGAFNTGAFLDTRTNRMSALPVAPNAVDVEAWNKAREGPTGFLASLKALFTGARAGAGDLRGAAGATEELAHHATGAGGRVRELFVILRELSVGNFTRLIGSATIELQRFGKLDLLMNPLVLGIGAVGGALAYVAYKASEVDANLRSFSTTVRVMGDGSLTSAAELEKFTEELKHTGVSGEDAKKTVTEIARSGIVRPGESTHEFAGLARDIAQYNGAGAAGTPAAAEDLVKAFSGDVDGAMKFAISLNALRGPQIAAIHDLDQHARSGEAFAKVYAAIRTAIPPFIGDLSEIEKAFLGVKNTWDDFTKSLTKSEFPSLVTSFIQVGIQELRTTIHELEGVADLIRSVKRTVLYPGSEEFNKDFPIAGPGSGVPNSELIPPRSPTATASPSQERLNVAGHVVDTPATAAEEQTLGMVKKAEGASVGPYAIHYPARGQSPQASSLSDVERARVTQNSHAFGDYGFEPSTYREAAKATGMNPEDISEKAQHDNALYMLRKYGANSTHTWYESGARLGRPFPEVSQTPFRARDPESAQIEIATQKIKEQLAVSSQLAGVEREAAEARKVFEKQASEQQPFASQESRDKLVDTQMLGFWRNKATLSESQHRLNEIEISDTDRIAAGYRKSAVEGLRAETLAQAQQQIRTSGGAPEEVGTAQRDIINRRTAVAISSSRQQSILEEPRIAGAESLARASYVSRQEEEKTRVETEAAVRTQNVLNLALLQGSEAYIKEASAIDANARAQIHREYAAAQGLEAGHQIQANRNQTQVLGLELSSVGHGSNEVRMQVDLLRARQEIEQRYTALSQGERDAIYANASGVIQLNEQLAESEQHQGRINELFHGIANTVDGELGNALKNALIRTPLEAGQHIKNYWAELRSSLKSTLGDIVSGIAQAAFIKPVTSTIASGLGLGQVAQQIGGFATGGDTVVGGSGGTDSQHVQFMATPGERVIVLTPAQSAHVDKTGKLPHFAGGGQIDPTTGETVYYADALESRQVRAARRGVEASLSGRDRSWNDIMTAEPPSGFAMRYEDTALRNHGSPYGFGYGANDPSLRYITNAEDLLGLAKATPSAVSTSIREAIRGTDTAEEIGRKAYKDPLPVSNMGEYERQGVAPRETTARLDDPYAAAAPPDANTIIAQLPQFAGGGEYDPATGETVYYNDAGQPFTVPGDKSTPASLSDSSSGIGQSLVDLARGGLRSESDFLSGKAADQPLLGLNRDTGEITGRIPALADFMQQGLAGGAPAGTLSSGIKLSRAASSAEDIAGAEIRPDFVSRVIDTAHPPENPEDFRGFLWGAAWYDKGRIEGTHVTDDPSGVTNTLSSGQPIADSRGDKFGDLGRGLYFSDAPQIWMGRSTGKWDFLDTLTAEQGQTLGQSLRSELNALPAGYVSQGERANAARDIESFASGQAHPSILTNLAGQPYNISFWKPDSLERIGIKPPAQPAQVPVAVEGKFAQLTRNISDAEASHLKESGYDGAFTQGSMGTTPQFVVWNNQAVHSFGDFRRAPTPPPIVAYHGSPHDFEALDSSKIGAGEGAQAYGRGLPMPEQQGLSLHQAAGIPLSEVAGASGAPKEAGIPGIRYLDQGSRASGEGSHNIAMFGDENIEILRKYGIAGPPSVSQQDQTQPLPHFAGGGTYDPATGRTQYLNDAGQPFTLPGDRTTPDAPVEGGLIGSLPALANAGLKDYGELVSGAKTAGQPLLGFDREKMEFIGRIPVLGDFLATNVIDATVGGTKLGLKTLHQATYDRDLQGKLADRMAAYSGLYETGVSAPQPNAAEAEAENGQEARAPLPPLEPEARAAIPPPLAPATAMLEPAYSGLFDVLPAFAVGGYLDVGTNKIGRFSAPSDGNSASADVSSARNVPPSESMGNGLEIPHLSEGGLIQQSGIAEVHSGEVVLPTEKTDDALRSVTAGLQGFSTVLGQATPGLQTLGRAASELSALGNIAHAVGNFVLPSANASPLSQSLGGGGLSNSQLTFNVSGLQSGATITGPAQGGIVNSTGNVMTTIGGAAPAVTSPEPSTTPTASAAGLGSIINAAAGAAPRIVQNVQPTASGGGPTIIDLGPADFSSSSLPTLPSSSSAGGGQTVIDLQQGPADFSSASLAPQEPSPLSAAAATEAGITRPQQQQNATAAPAGSSPFSASNLVAAANGLSLIDKLNTSLPGFLPSFLQGGSGSGVGSFLSNPFGLFASQIPAGQAITQGLGPLASNAAGNVTVPGLFGTTATFGSFLGGAGAGFGAGVLLNNALGGNPVGGTAGSAGGALAGAAIGTFVFPVVGTLLGGLIGGAAGGGLGGLIGGPPRGQSAGAVVGTNGQLTFEDTGGSQQNITASSQVAEQIGSFSRALGQLTDAFGNAIGTVSSDAVVSSDNRQGVRVSGGNIPGGTFGQNADNAVKQTELQLIHSLTNVTSDTLKKIFANINDPSQLQNAVQFAAVYDRLNITSAQLTASLNGNVNAIGPFQQALTQVNATFNQLTSQANQFGLPTAPITQARNVVADTLNQDFRINVAEALSTAVDGGNDFLASLIKIHQTYVQATSDAKALAAATDSAAQAQSTAASAESASSAASLVASNVPAAPAAAAPGFANGGTTPPGWILVGERGPEWMYQSGGATVLPNGQQPSDVPNREARFFADGTITAGDVAESAAGQLPGVGSLISQASGGPSLLQAGGGLLGLSGDTIATLGDVLPIAGPILGGAVAALTGHPVQGAIGAGASLLGFAVGGPIGGIIGGLLGGVVGNLFGPKPSNKASGDMVDLASGSISGFQSSGDGKADTTVQQISQGLSQTATALQKETGGTIEGSVSVQDGARDGIKTSYSGPLGHIDAKWGSASDAISQFTLRIAQNLNGLDPRLQTALANVTDASQVQDAITSVLGHPTDTQATIAGLLTPSDVAVYWQRLVAGTITDDIRPLVVDAAISGLFTKYFPDIPGEALAGQLRNAGLDYTVAAAAPGFANGGTTPPGWILVGERGPEWMLQPGGATVLPNGVMPSSVPDLTGRAFADGTPDIASALWRLGNEEQTPADIAVINQTAAENGGVDTATLLAEAESGDFGPWPPQAASSTASDAGAAPAASAASPDATAAASAPAAAGPPTGSAIGGTPIDQIYQAIAGTETAQAAPVLAGLGTDQLTTVAQQLAVVAPEIAKMAQNLIDSGNALPDLITQGIEALTDPLELALQKEKALGAERVAAATQTGQDLVKVQQLNGANLVQAVLNNIGNQNALNALVYPGNTKALEYLQAGPALAQLSGQQLSALASTIGDVAPDLAALAQDFVSTGTALPDTLTQALQGIVSPLQLAIEQQRAQAEGRIQVANVTGQDQNTVAALNSASILQAVLNEISNPTALAALVANGNPQGLAQLQAGPVLAGLGTDQLQALVTAIGTAAPDITNMVNALVESGHALPTALKQADEAITSAGTLAVQKAVALGFEQVQSASVIGQSVPAAQRLAADEVAQAVAQATNTQLPINGLPDWISQIEEAATAPLQLAIQKEKAAGAERVQIAQATGADLARVEKANADAVAQAWYQATSALTSLKTDITRGSLSGLTPANQVPAAVEQFNAVLKLVQGGNTNFISELAQAGTAAIQASQTAYGNGPQTASVREQVLGAIQPFLVSQSGFPESGPTSISGGTTVLPSAGTDLQQNTSALQSLTSAITGSPVLGTGGGSGSSGGTAATSTQASTTSTGVLTNPVTGQAFTGSGITAVTPDFPLYPSSSSLSNALSDAVAGKAQSQDWATINQALQAGILDPTKQPGYALVIEQAQQWAAGQTVNPSSGLQQALSDATHGTPSTKEWALINQAVNAGILDPTSSPQYSYIIQQARKIADAQATSLSQVPDNRTAYFTAINGLPAFAAGTDMTPPGLIMVGEKGPEWYRSANDNAAWSIVGSQGPEVLNQPGGATIIPFPHFAEGTADYRAGRYAWAGGDGGDGGASDKVAAMIEKLRGELVTELQANRKQLMGGQMAQDQNDKTQHELTRLVARNVGPNLAAPIRRAV